jgi:hypothetical protein
VQNKLSGIFSSAHLVADRGGDVDTGVYILGAQLTDYHRRDALLFVMGLCVDDPTCCNARKRGR